MPTIRTTVKNFADFSPDDLEQLAALRERIDFGTPPLTWTPMAETPWRILLFEDDRLVTHVSVMERTIEVGGQPVHVAGIRSVMTAPEARGRGHASAAMARAAEFIVADLPRVEHGLLFCIDRRVPLYQRAGWALVNDRVRIEQPGGPIDSPTNVMVRPFRGRPWPAGEVNLRGLPW